MLDMAVSDVIIACVMERREEDTVAVRQAIGGSSRNRQTQSIKSIAGVRLFWRRLEAATAFC